MSYQLFLFAPYPELKEKPEKCPECGGRLRLVHNAFTLAGQGKGFYEASCSQCPAKFRLYRNQEGQPDWELRSPSQDPTWCLNENWELNQNRTGNYAQKGDETVGMDIGKVEIERLLRPQGLAYKFIRELAARADCVGEGNAFGFYFRSEMEAEAKEFAKGNPLAEDILMDWVASLPWDKDNYLALTFNW